MPRRVLSSKSACLRRMLCFGESSLRRAIHDNLEHYHAERAHRGLGNERLERAEPTGTGKVEGHGRLEGILEHYRRAA